MNMMLHKLDMFVLFKKEAPIMDESDKHVNMIKLKDANKHTRNEDRGSSEDLENSKPSQ